MTMNSSTFRRFLLSVALLTLAAQISAAESWVEESNQYTMKLLEAAAEFTPEAVAGQGVTGYDQNTLDLGENLFERRISSRKEQISRLENALRTTEHPKVRQDMEILIKSQQDAIASAELNRRYMLPYYNVASTYFFGFRSTPGFRPNAIRRL
jgi:phage-related minor tail protein